MIPTEAQWRQYLSSPAWKTKRDQRMALDQYTCRACGAHDGLTVHHITYDRLEQEDMNDLTTFCRGCHRSITNHRINNTARQLKSKWDRIIVPTEIFFIYARTISGSDKITSKDSCILSDWLSEICINGITELDVRTVVIAQMVGTGPQFIHDAYVRGMINPWSRQMRKVFRDSND